MATFLHLGDIHLGYRQYKLAEREKDFFKAFLDVCQKHAIDMKVDFVLVAGDLFNSRSISPQSFNEAIYVFAKLKKAGIPVIAIEGNHDFKELGNYHSLKGSWYEALAQNQLMHFLYPSFEDSQIVLESLKLNEKFIGGGYIDLPIGSQIIRIVGSPWQGFNAGSMLPKYAEAISKLTSKADKTIFMFHAGHENYLPVNRGGVSGADFQVLNEQVDYVALGHIHDHYIIKNKDGVDFLFNPGSTEANCMAEAGIQRGGLLVTMEAGQSQQVKLVKDYYQRPFLKLESLNVATFPSQDHLLNECLTLAKKELTNFVSKEDKPIIQVNLHGEPLFERSNQELNNLKKQIEDEGALYCQIKWDLQKKDIAYSDQTNNVMPRSEFERLLLNEILENDSTIDSPDELTELMLRVKEMVSSNESDPSELLSQIESFDFDKEGIGV